MKLYTSKSNAKRAAVKAGLDMDTAVLHEEDGRYAYVEPEPETGISARRRVSDVDSPCLQVWLIAEQMEGARRKDVIAACEKAGIAFYTARTQYQQWLTAKRAGEKPA